MKKINQGDLLLDQIKSELAAAVRGVRYLISRFLHTFTQLTLEAFASRLKIGLPNCFGETDFCWWNYNLP